MTDVQNCLRSTGSDPFVVILIALLLLLILVAGFIALFAIRRRSRRVSATLAILFLFAAGSSIVVGPAPASAVAADCIQADADVTFRSGDITLQASFRGPIAGSDPVAAAVIVGGTGDVDRDGNGAGILMNEYEWIADLLSAQGIASLRFDKLGTGATGLGPYSDDPDELLSLTYDQLRVQPVRDALSFLAAQPGIDADRLILIGHSEGGAVTISVAADRGSGPEIAGLALIEPSYDRILNVVPSQLAQQMDTAVAGSAISEADAAALKAWMADGVEEIRMGAAPYPAPDSAPLPDAIDYTAVMQTTIANNIYGSDPAQMVISHAYRTLYGKQFDEIDPVTIAPSITVPVLVTCGTKDFNTPCGDGTVGAGVAALASAFAPGIARFVELTDVVHIMRDVGADDVPGLADQVNYPYSAQLATEITEFVAQFRD
jgi:pimeloyl-ACP methyl ester carboxylesterase